MPKLYSTARWERKRRHQLAQHPLCAMCLQKGWVEPATVVDHIVPHRGNKELFFLGALQSLCATHHNSSKQQLENKGYVDDIGVDGFPIDRNHPVYKTG